jgi:fatty acid desaturase
MNYHIEHHMYAAVPFYNLPKFHDAIADQLPEGPKSFLEGLRLVLSIRKRQEEDPGYVYVPKFPETATPPKTNGQRRTG